MADRDPGRVSADVDWREVARLVLTSREMDRVEEEELVPAKKVLYQFSARGHDMAQVLLGLQLKDGDAACGYYRSRPLLLALGVPLADALGSGMGLAGGYWLAARAIHPIEDISATALKISAGDLSQRINVADTENELGHLAAVLNSTFARLEAAFAQQARFTADASHELRTPVSVILTQTQAALSRPRTEPEYREARGPGDC